MLKHINIHQHFVTDLQKQKHVLGEFVQAKTKWQTEQLFVTHATQLKNGMHLISQKVDVGDTDNKQDLDSDE